MPSVHVWPVMLPFLVVLGWIVVQSTSWLAPLHHPTWEAAGAALRERLPGSISLDPTASYAALTRLVSYAGVLLLALYFGRDRRAAEWALYVIALAGSVYALYGLLEFVGGNHHILWWRKPAYPESLTSTFINRNSYATYDGLILICTTGLLVRSWLEKGWRWADAFLLPGWAVQCVALFLTVSRGGIVSTFLGMIVVLAVAITGRSGRTKRLAAAAALLVALGYVFAHEGGVFAYRLESSTDSWSERAHAYALTRELISERPVVGSGYGSFEDAFRMRRDAAIRGAYDKAHNTYLEDALEIGIPATALLLLSLGIVLCRCVRGLARRNSGRMLAAIGAGAATLVGVHSLVDFSLQMPAVAVTFLMTLGLAAAQSEWKY
jgi:O-antigen ligase